jgi:hypothetical protein
MNVMETIENISDEEGKRKTCWEVERVDLKSGTNNDTCTITYTETNDERNYH